MEMWHWRVVMVAILALIVCISTLSSPLPSFSLTEEKEEKISRLSIMSVSPQLGEEYLLFFNHFSAAIIAIINWRAMEPEETAIRDQWMILVSQETPDEDEKNPPITVAVVNGNGEEGEVVVESDIAPDQIPAAAFVAAKKTIQLILDSERTERAKKML